MTLPEIFFNVSSNFFLDSGLRHPPSDQIKAKINVNSMTSESSEGSSSLIIASSNLQSYSTKFKFVLGIINYNGAPTSSPSLPSKIKSIKVGTYFS